jgi:3D (Asp-Asp-Asp) domain-containing protein
MVSQHLVRILEEGGVGIDYRLAAGKQRPLSQSMNGLLYDYRSGDIFEAHTGTYSPYPGNAVSEIGPERYTMAARHFLKKAVYWPAYFLCIFFLGSASVSLGYQPAGTIHGGYVEIIGLDTTDYSGGLLFGPSAARSEQVGCLTPAHSPRPAPLNVSRGVTASWYGPVHQNKLTASGQRFDMHKNTLAHRTLPLGTKVRLVNPDNGKSAEGVVNDRGPYIKGRDVDVSYALAKQLGFVKKGVTKLDIETKFFLLAGERRYPVCKKLGRATIPACIPPDVQSGEEVPTIRLVENRQRQEIDPIDKANVLLAFFRDRHGEMDMETVFSTRVTHDCDVGRVERNLPQLLRQL